MISWGPAGGNGAGAGGPAVVCAWCGSLMSGSVEAEETSHGMCRECLADTGLVEVERVHGLSAREADRLPFGLLLLDDEGTVLRYNAAESRLSGRAPEETLGLNFFRDVAPCTRVQEFEGRFRRLLEKGEAARVSFSFVFRFTGGDQLVRVVLSYQPREGTVILVEGNGA